MMDQTEKKNSDNQPDSMESDKPSFSVSDKRHWVKGVMKDGEPVPAQRVRLPTYVEELKEKLDQKERKLNEFMSRVEEDNAGFRERMGREFERRMEKARADLILKIIPILDNLERAITSGEELGAEHSFVEGVKLVYNQFLDQLGKEGVEKIETLGKPFDPELSEALGVVPTEDPEQNGLIVDELEKGYTLGGNILRPAKVRINKLVQREEGDDGG